MPTAVLRMCYRKKHKGCKKKTVRKQWLEDLVVNQTMQLVKDDAAMESIIAKVMELQDRENTSLPLYEKQLRDAESGIQNMLNAIQAGILTSSTKERLEQLEETKREFEARIAEEKLAKPKIKEEFIRFWLLRFRKLDMTQPEQRQALVDTFINAIYLYDDKVLITFNYKEGTETITFGEAVKAEKSSDMSARGAPNFKRQIVRFYVLSSRNTKIRSRMQLTSMTTIRQKYLRIARESKSDVSMRLTSLSLYAFRRGWYCGPYGAVLHTPRFHAGL